MARTQFKGNTDRIVEISLVGAITYWLWKNLNTAIEVSYLVVVVILIIFLCWVWRKSNETD